MTEIDPAIAAGLDRLVPSYSEAVPDWDDVLRRIPPDRRRSRRFRPTRQRVVAAAVFVIGVGAATAILLHISGPNSGSPGIGGGSCKLTARYRGATYTGLTVEIAPQRGPLIGSAVIPPCLDAGPETIQVAALRGVSPRVALVWVGSNDTILVQDGVSHLPNAVTRLSHAPACRRTDVPIRLAGPWLGIVAPDGGTELTMRSPYDLEILAARATPSRYQRAFLTIRVPASLGRPLTEHDIHAVLDKGGSITVTATCGDGRYVAQQVRAGPPN